MGLKRAPNVSGKISQAVTDASPVAGATCPSGARLDAWRRLTESLRCFIAIAIAIAIAKALPLPSSSSEHHEALEKTQRPDSLPR